MDYEKELSQLKALTEKAKNQKIKAETRLESLKAQELELLSKLEALGVKPEALDNEIESLKNEIEKLLKEANELLPKDLS